MSSSMTLTVRASSQDRLSGLVGKDGLFPPSFYKILSILWNKNKSHKPSEPIVTALEAPQDYEDSEISKVDSPEGMRFCTNPTHKPAIDPQYVVKALREFMQDLYAEKAMKNKNTLTALMEKNYTTVARNISDKDVDTFWNKLGSVVSKERHEIWNSLYVGLQKYYTLLQERHQLNEQINNLKQSNSELKILVTNHLIKPLDDDELRAVIKEIQITKGPME